MKSSKKLILQRISKVVCFLLVFNIILCVGSYVLIPKKNSQEYGVKNYRGNSFCGEAENTIDIVFLGNSSAYKGFTPIELWNEYGYTGFVCGGPAQSIQESYTMLKNVLKKQKPKIVFFEAEGIFRSFNTNIKGEYPQASQNLIYIANEVDGINESVNEIMEQSCPFVKYHNRWSKLTVEDFTLTPDYTQHYPTKGYVIETRVKPYNGNKNYMKATDFTPPIQLTAKYYLDKMNDICKKNGAEMIFVSSPLPRVWDDDRHKAVQGYADENGMKYIDTNLSIKEMGIDWEKDSSDEGRHMNINGARKCTEFIGKYLAENYKLTDHRGDSAYTQWNSDYEEYLKQIDESQKKNSAP